MRILSRSFLGLAVLLLIAINAQTQGAAGGKSAVGSWKLNVDKSDFGSNPKPKSGSVTVSADSAASLKWHGSITSADGKTETYRFSGAEDGKQHPVTGNNSWKSAAYTRSDSGMSSESVIQKDGGTQKNDFSWSDDGN